MGKEAAGRLGKPIPFNCFSGTGWQGFLPRECLAGWTPAHCSVQVMRIWVSVVNSFMRDKQGCLSLQVRVLKEPLWVLRARPNPALEGRGEWWEQLCRPTWEGRKRSSPRAFSYFSSEPGCRVTKENSLPDLSTQSFGVPLAKLSVKANVFLELVWSSDHLPLLTAASFLVLSLDLGVLFLCSVFCCHPWFLGRTLLFPASLAEVRPGIWKFSCCSFYRCFYNLTQLTQTTIYWALLWAWWALC